jgi:transcriptional regulator with GAF, ATPase, and Fis domain
MVARTDASVLIQGETGTGKEPIAKAIHEESHRRSGPFVRLNCAAMPGSKANCSATSAEHSLGLDADSGRFQRADGGTLFLDEIGDLPI